MFYHLNELYGLTKWFDKFQIFSLTEQHVNGELFGFLELTDVLLIFQSQMNLSPIHYIIEVLNNCASLILKAQELNL